MGAITTKKSLVQLEKLSTASFCRRRLSVIMVRWEVGAALACCCWHHSCCHPAASSRPTEIAACNQLLSQLLRTS